MLRFTKKVDYGLMALQYIGIHQADGAVGVRKIADEFGIPPELLAKVLQRMARRGLIVSQAGPRGGYRLAQPPGAVAVGEVIRALEGPVAIVSCMTAHGDCPQTSRCTLRRPARKIQAAISDLLDRMTLAEIMDEEAVLLAATVNGGADEMSEEAGERR